jgi:hypothetical protein
VPHPLSCVLALPGEIRNMISVVPIIFKWMGAAFPHISKTFSDYTLQKKIRVTGAGYSRNFAYLTIKNPIKNSVRILSVKIRFGKTRVFCTSIGKDNSTPDERLGTSPIRLDGLSAARWEIPYQVIGAGKEPEEIVIEYETLRRSIKEKFQDPSLLRMAMKEVFVPDSAKNCLIPDFEGSQSFDDKENFPAAMGLARESFFNSTNFCETLRGTGVRIGNDTSRPIEIESVEFVKENVRTLAYLNNDYIQKRLVSTKTLRNQESEMWILPKELDPLCQGRRHVAITYRMSIGEESFVDTIEEIL